MEQFHVNFLYLASTFAMIAGRAGSYNVRPDVFAAKVAWDHMINRHASIAFSTVLTGIIVAAEYLTACQLDVWTWPMHLILQPDDGRARQQLFYCTNVPASIHNHNRFAREEQPHSPPRGANIDRLKISIQH